MSNEIQVFTNEEFGEVRTLVVDNEPWFVGKDIAVVLGYAKPRNAIATHVDNEDKKGARIQGTLGGTQNMTVINESGLYSLILSSKLSNAKKFKHWVTSEVLPTIRKTGGYVNNEVLFVENYFPEANDETKEFMVSTLKSIKQKNQIIESQKKEIEYKEDVIIGLVDDISY